VFELILSFWDVITHLDHHLTEWSQAMGGWLYVALFIIIFCETGLVITPFLPGDSLLFAVGALCALAGSPLAVGLIIPLLIVAAVLGDAVNYAVGRNIGPRIFTSEKSLLLNKKHLVRTQSFYERYGGKTIIIARFVPIIRTFAPFVAGIGRMQYPRFAAFNVIGAVLWVGMFVPLGYGFGNLPEIKRNFHYVILGIIVLSVMPAAIEILREWRARRVQASGASQLRDAG
jgi:membrane-associated protein